MLDAGKSDDPQQGPSINTDVITDVSSPEAAVDDVELHSKSDQSKKVSDSEIVDSQSKSDQSTKVSDSEDLQDLKDEISMKLSDIYRQGARHHNTELRCMAR